MRKLMGMIIVVCGMSLSILARAETPVVVDREATQEQLRSVLSQIGNLYQQTKSNPSLAAQLNFVLRQLKDVERQIAQAPFAGQVAAAPPTIIVTQAPPPVAIEVPPAGPTPIDSHTFHALTETLKGEMFPKNQLRVLSEAAPNQYYLVRHVAKILEFFMFEKDRLAALEIMAPRVLDRENFFQLYSAFPFGSGKEKARQILSR